MFQVRLGVQDIVLVESPPYPAGSSLSSTSRRSLCCFQLFFLDRMNLFVSLRVWIIHMVQTLLLLFTSLAVLLQSRIFKSIFLPLVVRFSFLTILCIFAAEAPHLQKKPNG